MLDTDTALAPVAISDTKDSKLTHTEEAPLGQEDREIAATEGSCSTEQSQGCSNKTKHATDGVGADSTLEEIAATHVPSLSDGVPAPEKLARTPDLFSQLENGQSAKNWYDTFSPNGMSPSSTFSSPLPLSTQDSVAAVAPAASKRSFQDDNVSEISAVRRPSTKKRPKGR